MTFSRVLVTCLIVIITMLIEPASLGKPDLMKGWTNSQKFQKTDLTRIETAELNRLVKKAKACNASGAKCRTRIEIRLMPYEQFKNYTEAVKCVQGKVPDSSTNRSIYDILVIIHRITMAPCAHGTSCFLTWHAEYLNVYETAIQECNPWACLPVVDWRAEFQMTNPCDSPVYTEPYYGNNQGNVTSGFQQYHKVVPSDCQTDYGSYINRQCDPQYKQPLYADFDQIEQSYTNLKDVCSPSNQALEDNHGSIHVTMGGHLSLIPCSPNDCLFYAIHAFIDYIFSRLRNKNGVCTYPTASDGIFIDTNCEGSDPAQPFYNYTCADGISVQDTCGYTYVTVPNTCTTDAQCNHTPDNVNGFFCDSTNRCQSKRRMGAQCTDDYQCFKGNCTSDPVCLLPPSGTAKLCTCSPSITTGPPLPG